MPTKEYMWISNINHTDTVNRKDEICVLFVYNG